jgi:hypothetical protein
MKVLFEYLLILIFGVVFGVMFWCAFFNVNVTEVYVAIINSVGVLVDNLSTGFVNLLRRFV